MPEFFGKYLMILTLANNFKCSWKCNFCCTIFLKNMMLSNSFAGGRSLGGSDQKTFERVGNRTARDSSTLKGEGGGGKVGKRGGVSNSSLRLSYFT